MKTPLFTLVLLLAASVAAAADRPGVEASTATWLTQVGGVRMPAARVSAESIVMEFVQPRYPREMRALGIPGFVRIDVAVDEDGRVIGANVLEANYSAFAREAIRAVHRWRFYPSEEALPTGRRIVRVPIEFALIAAR